MTITTTTTAGTAITNIAIMTMTRSTTAMMAIPDHGRTVGQLRLTIARWVCILRGTSITIVSRA